MKLVNTDARNASKKPWPSPRAKANASPPAEPHISFLYSYFEPMMYSINNDSYVPNQDFKNRK